MPRPGWDVISRTAPIPPQVPTDTGVTFIAGGTEKGFAAPTLVQSLDQYASIYGSRTGGQPMYDWVDVYFREGGGKLWVSAIPTTPGLMIAEADRSELSAMTRDELDALALDAGIEDPSSLPNKDAVIDALTGNGDHVEAQAITPAQIVSALALFTDAYGPGQVCAPGQVDNVTVNPALLQHAIDHNRVALIESAPGADAATLTTYASALKTLTGARAAGVFAPLAIVPGVTSGTTRLVGWTAVAAGIMARNDARGLNPNVPAAGVNGISSYALDVEKRFTDAEYTNLNAAGVNMAQYRWGALETFGYRTVVDQTQVSDWWSLGFARLRMAIEAEAGAIAERYVFSEIDGRGKTIAQFGGDLRGMLVPFYEAGALYGETAEDAFQVNVGSAVNTPTTIANGELHAVLMVRMSPFAEYVVIEIVKVSTTQAIAA
jgi:hypothetical protein